MFAWIYFFGYISIFIAVFAINMEVDNEDIILEYLEQEGDPMGENPLQEAPAETEGAIPEGDGQGAVLPQEGEPATGVMTRHRSAIVASEAALQLASQAMKKKQDEPPKGGANPGVRSSLPQPPTKKEGGRGTTNKSVQRGGHNGVTRGYHHSPAGSDIERGYESRESQGSGGSTSSFHRSNYRTSGRGGFYGRGGAHGRRHSSRSPPRQDQYDSRGRSRSRDRSPASHGSGWKGLDYGRTEAQMSSQAVEKLRTDLRAEFDNKVDALKEELSAAKVLAQSSAERLALVDADLQKSMVKTAALEKSLSDERARRIQAEKDVGFLRKHQSLPPKKMTYVLGMGPGDSRKGMLVGDLIFLPSSEQMAAFYERTNFVAHAPVIEAEYLQALLGNAPASERKTAERVLSSILKPTQETTPWISAKLPVQVFQQGHSPTDGVQPIGVVDVQVYVITRAYLDECGVGNLGFLCGNMEEVLSRADKRDKAIFKQVPFKWYIEWEYDLDTANDWRTEVPLTAQMFDLAANKPTVNYSFFTGSQRETGCTGEDKRLTPKNFSTTGYGSLKPRIPVGYNQDRSHKKGTGVIDSSDDEVVVSMNKKMGAWGMNTTAPKDNNKGPRESTYSSRVTGDNGRKKEGFYDTSNESLEEVCAHSKWAGAGPLMKDVKVKYGAETFSLEVAIGVAQEALIPLVMPDAPLRGNRGGDGRDHKYAAVPSSLAASSWAADCNYALFADVVKNIAAEVIPGYRTGQNLNHDEGKVLFMTMMKFGFQKGPDGLESPAKRWIKDLNVNASDPLALNYTVAAIIARYHTEEHQAGTLRNFQAGVQGNESLEAYFDKMLASAKGAEATMSFKEQANTIRAGMRNGTMVKAQLLGKPIPKMTSWEELVTLVKHTWLPEAINYHEEGPLASKNDAKAKGKGKSEGPGKVSSDDPPPPRNWCSHCKNDTHTNKFCYALYPDKRPAWYKDFKKENAGGENKSQGSGTNATANQEHKSAEASKGSGEKKQSGTPSKDGKSNGKGENSSNAGGTK